MGIPRIGKSSSSDPEFIPLDPLEQIVEKVRELLDKLEDSLESVGTDKLLTKPDNPPNLNVALDTRASESTLSSLNGKFPSAVVLGDALANPTTTLLGASLLGWDGTYWRRVRVNANGYLLCVLG